ncbi:MAG TPA: Holliday junction resolvase Hjc [Candidatus Bilamarchaeaceae archaeon]|nr:Holliday junction resolvase Hjc [Candidatus Bilamarchaeaceae archaeon]
MRSYVKGSRVERELIDFLHGKGFSVIRAAGSGVSSLSPDVLAFRHGIQYAFEVKAIEKEHLHIEKRQFLNLKKWEENTGITCLVGWRRNRKGWRFIPVSIFQETPKSFGLNWKTAETMGRQIEELI